MCRRAFMNRARLSSSSSTPPPPDISPGTWNVPSTVRSASNFWVHMPLKKTALTRSARTSESIASSPSNRSVIIVFVASSTHSFTGRYVSGSSFAAAECTSVAVSTYDCLMSLDQTDVAVISSTPPIESSSPPFADPRIASVSAGISSWDSIPPSADRSWDRHLLFGVAPAATRARDWAAERGETTTLPRGPSWDVTEEKRAVPKPYRSTHGDDPEDEAPSQPLVATAAEVLRRLFARLSRPPVADARDLRKGSRGSSALTRGLCCGMFQLLSSAYLCSEE
mmetsp:Transcript_19655/g.36926  ORF Transcript_19655/g.36926 Transcript_19655/m.36926 type:complete len:281 (+) Transcript_19655:626-1468(+)